MTNANGSATATVETLTAEVRVLQVGNRQITLSVARQLDHIPLPRLEVFGRIKLGNGYTGSYVIGRDLADGTLAVASYGHYAKTRDWRVELEVDPGLPKPALGWNVKSLRTHEVTIDGIPCTIRVSDCVRQEGPATESCTSRAKSKASTTVSSPYLTTVATRSSLAHNSKASRSRRTMR